MKRELGIIILVETAILGLALGIAWGDARREYGQTLPAGGRK